MQASDFRSTGMMRTRWTSHVRIRPDLTHAVVRHDYTVPLPLGFG